MLIDKEKTLLVTLSSFNCFRKVIKIATTMLWLFFNVAVYAVAGIHSFMLSGYEGK